MVEMTNVKQFLKLCTSVVRVCTQNLIKSGWRGMIEVDYSPTKSAYGPAARAAAARVAAQEKPVSKL